MKKNDEIMTDMEDVAIIFPTHETASLIGLLHRTCPALSRWVRPRAGNSRSLDIAIALSGRHQRAQALMAVRTLTTGSSLTIIGVSFKPFR